MTLEPGQTVAHYRLVEQIGEGGMGVVWKAVDTRLGREVALKSLAGGIAEDPDRLARLEREARLLASLNHPNIAVIHGLERAGPTPFLVLELVPGETLDERLARGALEIPEALRLGRQMTVALSNAHQAGVLHRDLKPGNIKVTPDGTVKILDFGLAKSQEGGARGMDPSLSPTLSAAATQAGVVLGTAAYMPPEQARGAPVDNRADVWGFGCVLFECLTGRRPFPGANVTDVLASVLKTEPDWSLLPAATPAAIRRLLRRCLAKEPDDRLRDIADARLEIDEALDPASTEPGPGARTTAAPQRSRALVAGLSLAAGALIASIVWSLRATEPPLFKFRLPITQIQYLQEPVLAPDGTGIMYGTGGNLMVQEFDQLEPRDLPGTEGAAVPVWSHDGRAIAFARGRKLYRTAAAGGDITAIADIPRAFGGGAGISWGEDDFIIFSTGGSGLLRVSTRGGDVETLLDIGSGDVDFHEPSVLPGGRGVLFVVHSNRGVDAIDILSGGQRKEVLHMVDNNLGSPVWSPSGHVVFERTGGNPGVWAVPYSLDSLEPTGAPFLVASNGAAPSISGTGMLAYRSGIGQGEHQLVWIDADGKLGQFVGTPQSHIDDTNISPDGALAAATVLDAGNWNLVVHDLQRGSSSRLTFDSGGVRDPAWSPDGKRIAYIARDDDMLASVTLDGRVEKGTITAARDLHFAPDGTLVYVVRDESTAEDIWYLPPGENAEPVAFLARGGRQIHPRLSPDGRYVAYISDESGSEELYVRPFPRGDGKWLISNDGAQMPRWSPAGDRLYYIQTNYLMAAEIRPGSRFSAGVPRRILDAGLERTEPVHGFAVDADGRFLVVKVKEGDPAHGGIAIVQNWIAEFSD